MFYCEDCGKARSWPTWQLVSSRGGCEICGKNKDCYDVPSKDLPNPKPPGDPLELVKELARQLEGKIETVGILPDGSGFAVMDLPLPKDHWIYDDREENHEPPCQMRMGVNHPLRKGYENILMDAAKYAIRVSTNFGKDDDFDPDALARNFVIGLLGYYTDDGCSHI